MGAGAVPVAAAAGVVAEVETGGRPGSATRPWRYWKYRRRAASRTTTSGTRLRAFTGQAYDPAGRPVPGHVPVTPRPLISPRVRRSAGGGRRWK